jgi:hypothetical protein
VVAVSRDRCWGIGVPWRSQVAWIVRHESASHQRNRGIGCFLPLLGIVSRASDPFRCNGLRAKPCTYLTKNTLDRV